MDKSKNLNIFQDKSLPLIVIAILILAMYLPTWFWMGERWFARDSYYSHGPLIPFVSFFLIWQNRKKILDLPIETNRLGLILFSCGIGLHLLSALFRVYFTSGFSLILVLMGLVLHAYGPKVFRQLAFPIFFLVFMIPLPMVIITNLSFNLKLLAAKGAVYILNEHLRIPCFDDGSTIIMRHARVVVDDVCSGLRSLISLAALGSLFAFWIKGGWVKKILFFMMTIPVAVITNIIRIIFLSLVSEIWGPQYVKGFWHDVSGYAVFALAFLFLYLIEKMMEK